MAILKKDQLLEILISTIEDCGWHCQVLSETHPFKFLIYKNGLSEKLKVIIYNLSHGGGKMRPDDEYRIQIKEASLSDEPGYKTLILGYWSEVNVFAGFDLQMHKGTPGYSSSMQIKTGNLQSAILNGFSPCDKGNGEIAVAFRPDFLVDYALSLSELHGFGKSKKDLSILTKIIDENVEVNDSKIEEATRSRQTIIMTVKKRLRQNNFTSRVLTAYGSKCGLCELQLKLIDAAHIIPVSHEKSTDETKNGVALCALHHRAYDSGLVTFNETYKAYPNKSRMKNLKEIGHEGGVDKFLADLRPLLRVPPSVSDRPLTKYVTFANKLRGWEN